MLRIKSVGRPFTSPGLAVKGAAVLARADAMGLFPERELTVTLDAATFGRLAARVGCAGIGGAFVPMLTNQTLAGESKLLDRTAREELAGIDRAIWAVEVPDATVVTAAEPVVAPEILTGGADTYEACRREARRLRREGAVALRAPSAALVGGGAHGWRVEAGLQPAAARDGQVIVLFGPRPDLVGWQVVDSGRPAPDLLERARALKGSLRTGSGK